MELTKCKDHRVAIVIAAGAYLLVLGAGCSNPQRTALSSVDVESVKQVFQAYTTALVANDPESVLANFTEDAVLVPSGNPAVEGADAIREFFWPADSPPRTEMEFTLVQQEVAGHGDLAFARGSFAVGGESDGESWSSSGEYISLLRRLPDGSWRISHHMWSDSWETTAAFYKKRFEKDGSL